MKITGVIAEYNPFHNGHAWHLAQTRADADYVVVCMAGSWTQRGEAARLSKWTRAEMALRCGADAVFELPALFAAQTADAFARGGVAILSGLGADALSFGSETDDLSLLSKLAELRESEPDEVSEEIRRLLAEGKSHARARGEATAKYLGTDASVLNAPNLTLGAEYLRAIRQQNSRMVPKIVPRRGGYHDTEAQSGFPSATAIRFAMAQGRMADALNGVPECVRTLLESAEPMHAPDDLLLDRLRSMSEAEIAALPDVSEGLERRVKRCAAVASSREALIEMLKCKRYTRSRLSRLCAHALLGITSEVVLRNPLPAYARLIGLRADARPLLKELKARSALPIVSDAAQLADSEIFRVECRATDLRALQCETPDARRAGQEFTRKFVTV